MFLFLIAIRLSNALFYVCFSRDSCMCVFCCVVLVSVSVCVCVSVFWVEWNLTSKLFSVLAFHFFCVLLYGFLFVRLDLFRFCFEYLFFLVYEQCVWTRKCLFFVIFDSSKSTIFLLLHIFFVKKLHSKSSIKISVAQKFIFVDVFSLCFCLILSICGNERLKLSWNEKDFFSKSRCWSVQND